MAINKLNPPLIGSKTIAQKNADTLIISFLMNKSVGWSDFDEIVLMIKTVQSNNLIATLNCSKNDLYVKDSMYWGHFESNLTDAGGNKKSLPLLVGQHYKIQIAYSYQGSVGFFSNVSTFKFTTDPTVQIEGLTLDTFNFNSYNYTGYYYSSDSSEKVYSYEFNLYDNNNQLLMSSGEQLHNSSLDTETDSSTDSWTVRYDLTPGKDYLITYKIKTVNGIEKSSPTYRLQNGANAPSNLLKYYDFVAVNNKDSACVELILEPKKDVESKQERKLINGRFILVRASSEDNYQTWNEMTRFLLASQDTAERRLICKDYCVSQGVVYKYGLQVYNNQNLYSTRVETSTMPIDFEDMFLSDGKRQLRVRFNPKVSSFKTTLLESKIDTIGGKYPFFFRNGNVRYKEFPISGLISALMDTEEEFMQGIWIKPSERTETPSSEPISSATSTSLTDDNFRREREFKLEVLNWLTNGEPKLFRSPGEGSFIVRLMNVSLAPVDTLGRMLHTFSCTAYEVADYNFENLQKYGMMIEPNIETRELKFYSKSLDDPLTGGELTNLSACVATVIATPHTQFYYYLEDSDIKHVASVGNTGVFVFPQSVLKDSPLSKIGHEQGVIGWWPSASLTYARYENYEVDHFSYLHKVEIKDNISQWYGNSNKNGELQYHFDKEQILKSMGVIYYLSISKRPITHIGRVERQFNGDCIFYDKYGIVYEAGYNELLIDDNGIYYDGYTTQQLGTEDDIDYTFQLRTNEDKIDLSGINAGTLLNTFVIPNCESVINVGGRIVLTFVSNVDYLYLGNGVYVDIAYQEINKYYTIEETDSRVKDAREAYEQLGTEAAYNYFCELFFSAAGMEEEDLIENAI